MRHVVTLDQVKDAEDAEPLFLRLIFSGKMQVFIAPPNGGKTTIMTYAAGEMARAGLSVWYFNLDASISDLKYYQAAAFRDGFNLIAPLGEATEEEVTRVLDYMVAADDLTGEVIILDTLKKFVKVVSKESAEFYKKLRALTRKGCTVIALGHANKYPDKDGNLIYEGTGDLRADFDNLCFLYPLKDPITRSMTVSTSWSMEQGAKARCVVQDATFKITPDREVFVVNDYIDVREALLIEKKEREDIDLIATVVELLADGPANQSAVIERLKVRLGVNHKTVKRVLRDHAGRHWVARPGMNYGELRYYRPDHAAGLSLGVKGPVGLVG